MADESKSIVGQIVVGDIVGVSEPLNTVAKGTVKGAGAFLSRICLPAADELGLWFKDIVSLWRQANIEAMTARAQARLQESGAPEGVHAHPRLVHAVVEQGSWNDDPVVQDLWAGLLASSCTEDGDDDSNLVFVTLLSQLTKAEARLIKHLCETAATAVTHNGLIFVESQQELTLETLREVMGIDDLYRIDREIDHLNRLGLLHGAFELPQGTILRTAPSSLALNMFVRCQGSRRSPLEFFGLIIPPPPGPREATLVR